MSNDFQAQPETEVAVDEQVIETTPEEGGEQPESKEPEAKGPEEAKQPEPKEDKTEAEKRAERKAQNQQRAWERLIEEKAVLKAKVEMYEQMHAKQGQSEPQGVPKRDAYGSDEEYVQALTDYKVEQKLAAVKEELSRSQTTSKVQESWSSKISKAAQTYPDYQEVLAEAQDVPINPEVADELMSSDLGGDLTYYLAKHPEEVDTLNRMDARGIARYVGRLEEKIERERANVKVAKVSKAPAPIKPVSGTTSPSIKSLEDMSMEEYVKYMDKQEAAKRKR